MLCISCTNQRCRDADKALADYRRLTAECWPIVAQGYKSIKLHLMKWTGFWLPFSQAGLLLLSKMFTVVS